MTVPSTVCRGGAFGTMPLGTGALGSLILGGLFEAEVIDAVTIDVSHVPLPGAVLDPNTWAVAPIGLGVPVTVISATELVPFVKTRLTLEDPGMTLGSITYLVSLTVDFDEVRDDCDTITVISPPAVRAVAPAPLSLAEQPYDIANPQLVRDARIIDPPPLGQYQINDRGDYALDSRLEGLRKRILRRISTLRGGFFHLPNYGLAQDLKGPIRPSPITALAADAKIQVEREPEVVRAQVSVTQLRDQPGIVVMKVSARTIGGLDVAASQKIDLRSPTLQ